MQIGNYKIGSCHVIIKKFYKDGSIEYETNFSSREDLGYSVIALRSCIGTLCGTGTDNPRILIGFDLIYGKEKIIKELGH